MALNCSPEFNSSNPKPSATELFGTLGHHMSKLRRAHYAVHYTKFQASEPSGSETVDFFILPMYFYASNQGAPGIRHISDPQTLI